MTNTDSEPIYRPEHMTLDEIRNGCITITNNDNVDTRICIAQEELRQGIDTVEKYPHAVTMYGSARLAPGSEFYELARTIAFRVANELKYAVISGGGPGIMQAANQGASDAGGVSIGLTIKLPREQSTNPYVNVEVPFYYFFTRKTTMSFSSLCYLAFPGGFGTFDEIFEIITLMQTGKIPRIPIMLVGHRFWSPIIAVVKQVLLDDFATISASDFELFTITDNVDEIMTVIKNAPERSAYHSSDSTIEPIEFAQ